MADGRTKNGGARAGAGRKPAETRDELARLLDKAVPTADREVILTVMAQKAMGGDIKAASFLFSYAYGRPVERQEVVGDNTAPLAIKVIYDDIKPAHEE